MAKTKKAWFFVPNRPASKAAPGAGAGQAKPVPRFQLGGTPMLPTRMDWPECDACEEPMRFYASITRDDNVLVVFICAGGPSGPCAWHGVDAIGKRVALFETSEELEAKKGPVLDKSWGTDGIAAESVSSEADDEEWEKYEAQRSRLGRIAQLGGHPFPDAGEGDDPVCPDCEADMEFVAQLAGFSPLDELLRLPKGSEILVWGCTDLCSDESFALTVVHD